MRAPQSLASPTINLRAKLAGPTRIPAPWLPKLERRIKNSAAQPEEELLDNDGSWLRRSVIDAADCFFRETSDVLPSEPYLYGSTKGDLVAEYNCPAGKMTQILGDRFVICFTVINGKTWHTELEVQDKDFEATRIELRRITKSLAHKHGEDLDTGTR